MTARTLFDRIWERHAVADLGDGWSLLHVDRHLLHDLSGPPALARLADRGLPVRAPELTFATPDHAVSSRPGRTGGETPDGARLHRALHELCGRSGVRLFDIGARGQGIVHVAAPELGLSLPGLTVVCGDSHTCTHGGIGALGFGIGSSEITHVLATQTIRQRRPRRMRIWIEGRLGAGVTAKDLILGLIARLGTQAGVGFAVEFAGPAVTALPVEARMTLCNLGVELGAKMALIAPDAATLAWIEGRPFAPRGADWARAAADWLSLASDTDATFDREERFDTDTLEPMVSWGVSPDQSLPISGRVPDPAAAPSAEARAAMQAALTYMGLAPGTPLDGLPVDWVFIGSCANSRLSDLRAAAEVLRGRQVRAGVSAWVVPGSELVRQQAEAEGLDTVFRAAGFAWRAPGCSLCVAANGEQVPPGARAASTSNRNFVGRQGPGARTHLVSPAMAAAAAIRGALCDVRAL